MPPLRELPAHSVPTKETSIQHRLGSGGPSGGVTGNDGTNEKETEETATDDKPVFREPKFTSDGVEEDGHDNETDRKEDDILSPTERA